MCVGLVKLLSSPATVRSRRKYSNSDSGEDGHARPSPLAIARVPWRSDARVIDRDVADRASGRRGQSRVRNPRLEANRRIAGEPGRSIQDEAKGGSAGREEFKAPNPIKE